MRTMCKSALQRNCNREDTIMNIENLSPEQLEKARTCKTSEELLALAKAEGIELSDEELSAVSGGGDWNDPVDLDKCSLFMVPR